MKNNTRSQTLIYTNHKLYTQVHYWLHKNYGSADHCEIDRSHKAKRFEWSNISHKYLKDIKDFRQLCKSCHAKYDSTEYQRIKMSVTQKGTKRTREAIEKTARSQWKPVIQMDLEGNVIGEYPSLIQAAKETNSDNIGISSNIGKRRKTHNGFIWKLKKSK